MNRNFYKCRTCGVQKNSKARIGSREFESTSYIVQAYQSSMLGRITDDPGRPAAQWAPEGTDLPYNDLPGWRPDKEEDANFYSFYRSMMGDIDMSERLAAPFRLRMENAKDFEIRISLPDRDYDPKEYDNKTDQQLAAERLEMLLKVLSPVFDQKRTYPKDDPTPVNAGGLTEDEVKQLKCYLVGGHDWEFIGQYDNEGNLVEKPATEGQW